MMDRIVVPSFVKMDAETKSQTPTKDAGLHTPTKSRRTIIPVSSRALLVLMAMFLFLATILTSRSPTNWYTSPPQDVATSNNNNSVYVPGAGFSGFWFTLGRLQSIADPQDFEYYCFSAGCMGVVATLSNQGIQRVANLALNIQQEYKTGQLERHDIVTKFVQELVNHHDEPAMTMEEENCNNMNEYNSTCCSTRTTTTRMNTTDDKNNHANNRPVMENPDLLSRLHIITSVRNGWFGWKTLIRTPQNLEELEEMLVQTTWIPFATGSSLWQVDSQTGQKHMDGGVTAVFHPKCQHYLGLPITMPTLFLNFLNANLGWNDAIRFYKAGVKMGL